MVDEPQELLRRVVERHQRLARRFEVRTELVVALVVAPHERELHPAAVPRLEEGLLDGLLLRDLAAVPVVVPEEHVDARVRGQRDLGLHVLRVRAVEVAGIGAERLLVPGEERARGLHEVPFARVPLRAEPLGPLRVLVPVRVVDGHHLHVLLRPLRRAPRAARRERALELLPQRVVLGHAESPQRAEQGKGLAGIEAKRSGAVAPGTDGDAVDVLVGAQPLRVGGHVLEQREELLRLLAPAAEPALDRLDAHVVARLRERGGELKEASRDVARPSAAFIRWHGRPP